MANQGGVGVNEVLLDEADFVMTFEQVQQSKKNDRTLKSHVLFGVKKDACILQTLLD